jgi:predicted ATPase
VLQTGLGNTKVLIDLLFAVLFLVPYIAVKKSDEISGGVFLKEVVINSMSSALLMHLLSGRTIEKSLQKIKNEFDYHKALGKK